MKSLLTAAALAVLPATAVAASQEVEIAVDTTGLDLSSPEVVTALKAEVAKDAEKACTMPAGLSSSRDVVDRSCKATLIAAAKTEIDRRSAKMLASR